jgi:NADH dehydrogenase
LSNADDSDSRQHLQVSDCCGHEKELGMQKSMMDVSLSSWITGEPSASRPRVIIVGGGFGGLAAARALKNASAEIVLIDRRNHYLFQPLLYQVATAVLSASDIAAPIRQLGGSQKNLRVVLGEVSGVNVLERQIILDCAGRRGVKISYDFLVLATGTHPTYFGHDQFAKFAPALKTLADAEFIRGKILSAFERAELEDDPEIRKRFLTFVLVGGGPTGVELAASLAQMATVTLRSNFRHIDPQAATIILLEGGKRLLASFDEALAEKASAQLQSLGVTIRTGVMVEQIDDDGVVVGGTRIPSATVIWTAGVKPHPLGEWLGAPTDRAGRVVVGPCLTIPSHSEIFVIGDTAAVLQDGKPLPGVAQVALQQGKYVGKYISAKINKSEPSGPFEYIDRGNMAVVGKNFAILESNNVHTSGSLTWLIWAFIHVMSLPHAQNRVRVYLQWLWSYFTGQRSSRIISEADHP